MAVQDNEVFISGSLLGITLYDIYLSMTGDNGITWTDIRDNLPLSPDLPTMILLKINQGRLFTAPSNNGLWYRDDLTTGFPGQQKHEFSSLTLFPNPATYDLTLITNEESFQTGSCITVYDIYGREVFKEIVREQMNTWHIHVFSWPSGIYFFKLQAGNQIVVERLVKL